MIEQHIHEGEFIAKFPLIPGHETVGVVAAKGKVGVGPYCPSSYVILKVSNRTSRASKLETGLLPTTLSCAVTAFTAAEASRFFAKT